jgi:pimeloyl-ACP methyl ester carboxylesterase
MSDTTWILLRGLARESGHWGDFLDRFQAARAPESVLTIDLPGTGEFRDSTSPANMAEIFQFVRGQAIKRASSGAAFRILAVSLGGMVAMEWMRQRPDELASVVLVNTSLKAANPFYQRLRWQSWPALTRFLTTQAPRERERALIEVVMNDEGSAAKALPLWSRLAADRPVGYRTLINQLLAASRFEGLRERVDVEVLLLNGLGDRLVDPGCSTALQQKWGWPIERHPWAGHDLPSDDPDWVIEKINVRFPIHNAQHELR